MIPLHLSEASGVPLYRQIVDQVADAVRSGQLAAGTRLPSVRELSSQLLVSGITVRRAYADLEAAGVLVRQQGRGTFVADDVAPAAEALLHEEAREALRAAVDAARAAGLDEGAIREVVAARLHHSSDDPGRSE